MTEPASRKTMEASGMILPSMILPAWARRRSGPIREGRIIDGRIIFFTGPCLANRLAGQVRVSNPFGHILDCRSRGAMETCNAEFKMQRAKVWRRPQIANGRGRLSFYFSLLHFELPKPGGQRAERQWRLLNALSRNNSIDFFDFNAKARRRRGAEGGQPGWSHSPKSDRLRTGNWVLPPLRLSRGERENVTQPCLTTVRVVLSETVCRCSLSPKERAGVRGKATRVAPSSERDPGTVRLCESSGRAGGLHSESPMSDRFRKGPWVLLTLRLRGFATLR